MGNKSIERSLSLLTSASYNDDFIVIKVVPNDKSCCCFHCWPNVWNAINMKIAPQGPIKDEGDILLKYNDDQMIL